MAEPSGADKTEKPSPQKLKKAREVGQVVRSRDLATAIGIFASLKVLVLLAPGYLDDFRQLFALGFPVLDGPAALDNLWSTAFASAVWLLAKMVLPLAIVPLAIVLGSLIPGGWVVSTAHWMPRMERLSPMQNLGRLATPRHAFELGLSIVKATALAFVLVKTSRDSVDAYLGAQSMPLDRALEHAASLMLDSVMAMCAVFLVIAAIDVPAQAFFFARGQRMTKQEIREEHKTNEGRPEVRQRIRQLQRQLSRRSVRKSVPGADVVIVNPEHYAVALKYDQRRAEAPFVIAKGLDDMALYIREVALAHGVETLTIPPLARAIYNTSQVQQQIPMPLYKAVAQVLNYVLQIRAFRSGRRVAQPKFPSDLHVPDHLSEALPA